MTQKKVKKEKKIKKPKKSKGFGSSFSSFGTTFNSMKRAKKPSGKLIKNTARQPNNSVRPPPINGPITTALIRPVCSQPKAGP